MNRLIASLERAGIGPNQNVYAELGTTWWNLMRTPTQAAHVLGKLLKHVGEDNVVCGAPTACSTGRRSRRSRRSARSQISGEFQERYGYPALTKELKAKILGRNAARLYGIEPVPATVRLHAQRAREDPRGASRRRPAARPRVVRRDDGRPRAPPDGGLERDLALEVGRRELVPVRPTTGGAPRPTPRAERQRVLDREAGAERVRQACGERIAGPVRVDDGPRCGRRFVRAAPAVMGFVPAAANAVGPNDQVGWMGESRWIERLRRVVAAADDRIEVQVGLGEEVLETRLVATSTFARRASRSAPASPAVK